jgi:LemA protein
MRRGESVMADAREQLSQEGFTNEEAGEILQRAAELQGRAERLDDRMGQKALEAGAEAAGIQREFIEQAIQELKAEREREAARRAAQQRTLSTVSIIVAVFLIVSAFFSHSALNARLADVEAKRAQLEIVLQRRHDLIPNLIALAKAFAVHEKALIASIAAVYQELEKAKEFAEKQALEQKLDAALRQLMATLQADPKTSSTALFLRLSDEMAGAENRIAVERKRYNEAVAPYNQTARSFPVVLLRPLLGFPQSIPYFAAAKEAQKPPTF